MPQDNPMSHQALTVGISSMIRDEPGYRVRMEVEAFHDPNGIELVLRVVPAITWWKSLSYFPQFQGGSGSGPELRIETKDSVKESTQYLSSQAITAQGCLELWKGGALGFGAFAGVLPINAWANRGRRLVFTWIED